MKEKNPERPKQSEFWNRVRKYPRKKVDYKKIAPGSRTVPDQSLSIREIVRRYVRGIPVDVVQRDPVYMDQSEHDFEAMARKDFAEKHQIAAEFKERAKEVQADLEENAKKHDEAKRKAKQAPPASDESGKTGIDPLDNTMPVDTKGKK